MDAKTSFGHSGSNWFAVGLLDGTWSGGKVTVAVNSLPLPSIHLVHILAERILKKMTIEWLMHVLHIALILTCFFLSQVRWRLLIMFESIIATKSDCPRGN